MKFISYWQQQLYAYNNHQHMPIVKLWADADYDSLITSFLTFNTFCKFEMPSFESHMNVS
jgi:hypothetical protein